MESHTLHVAIFLWLGMGHLIPLVEFGKRLTLHHGFSVTFIARQLGDGLFSPKRIYAMCGVFACEDDTFHLAP
jgi:hypothetical protein